MQSCKRNTTSCTSGSVTAGTKEPAGQKNNVRPFVLPGSKDSPLRLCWMNGDYYYWIVCQNYPNGYPTSIRTSYAFPADAAAQTSAIASTTESTNFASTSTTKTLSVGSKRGATAWTIIANWSIDANNYAGTLLKMGNLTYGLDAKSEKPYAKVGNATFSSQNRLGCRRGGSRCSRS